MRFHVFIFLLTLLLSSCQQDKVEALDGYWFRYADEKTDNSYFPFELHYQDDSLFMVDENNFTHRSKYLADRDTLILTLSDGSRLKINLELSVTVSIFFGKGKFWKGSAEQYTSVPRYDLIGYKTNQILKNDNVAGNVHLIKKGDSVKVILNDITTDLRSIKQFLICEDCQKVLSTNLYLGKNIDFLDLLSAYRWIAASGVRRVTLITGNSGFDKFYIQKDYINIGDSLMNDFFQKEGMPPTPKPNQGNSARIILTIKDANDYYKLNSIGDSLEYLLQVDQGIRLMDYLDLNQRVHGKENIRKEIKRLTIE